MFLQVKSLTSQIAQLERSLKESEDKISVLHARMAAAGAAQF